MEYVCGYAGVGFVRVGLSPATGSTCLRLNLNLYWTGASLPPPPPPCDGVRLVVGVRLRRSLPSVPFSAEQLSCHLSVGPFLSALASLESNKATRSLPL